MFSILLYARIPSHIRSLLLILLLRDHPKKEERQKLSSLIHLLLSRFSIFFLFLIQHPIENITRYSPPIIYIKLKTKADAGVGMKVSTLNGPTKFFLNMTSCEALEPPKDHNGRPVEVSPFICNINPLYTV